MKILLLDSYACKQQQFVHGLTRFRIRFIHYESKQLPWHMLIALIQVANAKDQCYDNSTIRLLHIHLSNVQQIEFISYESVK